MLAVLRRHLAHRLIRHRLHRHPLRGLGLAAGRRRAGSPGRDVEEIRQLVAGVHVAAAVQVAHQVNQVAALVAGGEIAPGALGQVDLERAGALVGAGRVGCGVLLAAVYSLATGEPVRQYALDGLQGRALHLGEAWAFCVLGHWLPPESLRSGNAASITALAISPR
ncbi:hypothetical protein D9M68_619480 [compost metagenome]